MAPTKKTDVEKFSETDRQNLPSATHDENDETTKINEELGELIEETTMQEEKGTDNKEKKYENGEGQ
jgi:hypothetical protein